MRLVQTVQKVALILIAVLGFEQLTLAVEILHARIVAGGDIVSAQADGMIEKGRELDLRIAQHVRVRRPPSVVLLQKGREDTVAVFFGKVHDFDINAQDIGDTHHVDQILPRAAILVGVVVFPVLHEQTDDAIALLLEQQRGD